MANTANKSAAAVQGAAAAASANETSSVSVKVIGVELFRSKAGKPMVSLLLKDSIKLFKKGDEVEVTRLDFQAATLKSQLITASGNESALANALRTKKMFEFSQIELDVLLVSLTMTVDLTLHEEGEIIEPEEGSDGDPYEVQHTFTEYVISGVKGQSPLTSVVALRIDIMKESKNCPGLTVAQAYIAKRDGIVLDSAALAFM